MKGHEDLKKITKVICFLTTIHSRRLLFVPLIYTTPSFGLKFVPSIYTTLSFAWIATRSLGRKIKGRNCNHCVLPLHCWGVVPVSPEVALLLSSTWSSVGALNSYTIHQVTSLFPFTRFHFSIPLLIVDKSVLHRVAGMHETVQDAANFHDVLRRLWAMLLRSEKYLKPVGQDAEGVYYHLPGLRKPVVEDPPFTGL